MQTVVLLLAFLIALATVVIVIRFLVRNPSGHTPTRQGGFISTPVGDITLQSADNLRLLSEKQLKELEGEAPG